MRDLCEGRHPLSAGFPVDILVRATEEITRCLQQGDSFVTEVMTRGKVMYEARHA
ncbi:MAG: hypothetical protein WCO56_19380 [Verrucomicrobiota bacterium]